MVIHEVLLKGAANAQTGRALAKIFDCDIRNITEAVERERRAGQPICANARGKNAGYYLAETPEELEAYCNQLYHRGGELFKTRRALITVLEQLKQKREQSQTSDPKQEREDAQQ